MTNAAIDCLEREIEMLETNHRAGGSEEQQGLRERNIGELKAGLEKLNATDSYADEMLRERCLNMAIANREGDVPGMAHRFFLFAKTGSFEGATP